MVPTRTKIIIGQVIISLYLCQKLVINKQQNYGNVSSKIQS
jgi:hypothetical protein